MRFEAEDGASPFTVLALKLLSVTVSFAIGYGIWQWLGIEWFLFLYVMTIFYMIQERITK